MSLNDPETEFTGGGEAHSLIFLFQYRIKLMHYTETVESKSMGSQDRFHLYIFTKHRIMKGTHFVDEGATYRPSKAGTAVIFSGKNKHMGEILDD